MFKYFLYGLLAGCIFLLGVLFAKNYLESNYVSKEELFSYCEKNNGQFLKDSNLKKRGNLNSLSDASVSVKGSVVGIFVAKVKRKVLKPPLGTDPFIKNFLPKAYKNEEIESRGSGFIYSPDGYILTNEHVIHDYQKIVVSTTEGKDYQAEVIGSDEISDIAVLKINVKNHNFSHLGNSDNIDIGEWVLALGNPYGLFRYTNEPLVTAGVISGKDITFGKTQRRFYGDMIQTDASIYPGNSGGPLVDDEGRVIGLNTMVYSKNGEKSVGIGFAIPINRVIKIANILIDNGYVNRNIDWGFMLDIEVTSQKLKQFNLPSKSGVLIKRIADFGPAAKAGFKKNDLIVGVENIRINNFNDIRNALFNAKDYIIGDKISFYIYRGQEVKKIIMQLETYKA